MRNLTTVGPVKIVIRADSGVARNGALFQGNVTSRVREGEITTVGVEILRGSTGKVVDAVRAVAVGVGNRGLATIARTTVAILPARGANVVASSKTGKITILTTTAIDASSTANNVSGVDGEA